MKFSQRLLQALGANRPRTYSGYVDGVFGCELQGWAVGTSESDPADVEVTVNDVHKYYLKAADFRGDLREHGIRGGNAGFSWTIPWKFFDGEDHHLSVRNCSSVFSLGNAKHTFRFERPTASPRESIKEIRFPSGTWRDLEDKAKQSRKAAVVASFSKSPEFLRTQHRLFMDLRNHGYTVIVCHADGADKPARDRRFPEQVDCVIYRTNSGYDFGSWALGIELLSDALDDLDELLLVNDSMFGTLHPVIGMLDRLNSPFQCVTDSYEKEYHAQSYLIRFKRDAIRDRTLRNFFLNYGHYDDKSTVIAKGELGLSGAMLSAGFELDALFPYDRVASAYLDEMASTIGLLKDAYERLGLIGHSNIEGRFSRLNTIAEMLLDGVPMNPTHFFWRILISNFGFSMIKRELLLTNPAQVPDLILAQLSPVLQDIVDKEDVREYSVRENAAPSVWARSALRNDGTVNSDRKFIE